MSFMRPITPEFCENHQGFRYSSENCMLEGAIEKILAEEDCYPQFHARYFMSQYHLKLNSISLLLGRKTQNQSLLESMPFIKKDLSKYATCKGAALLRSRDILNKLSMWGTVSPWSG